MLLQINAASECSLFVLHRTR